MIDDYRRQSATQRAKDMAETYAARLKEFRRPAKKQEQHRREARECRPCWYLIGSRISGQAFTHWKCQHCGAEDMWPNTGYPLICEKCSDELGACVRCVGDREVKK